MSDACPSDARERGHSDRSRPSLWPSALLQAAGFILIDQRHGILVGGGVQTTYRMNFGSFLRGCGRIASVSLSASHKSWWERGSRALWPLEQMEVTFASIDLLGRAWQSYRQSYAAKKV